MTRTWLRAAAARRWRSWLVLGLLIGAVVGAMTTAVAGAHRTSTSVARYLETNAVSDIIAQVRCEPRRGEAANCFERLRDLPIVADLTTVKQVGAQFPDIDGQNVQPVGDSCYSDIGVVLLLGDPTGRFGRDIHRWTLSEGRLADPDKVDEVVISRELGRRLDLHPGDVLPTSLVTRDVCQNDSSTFPVPIPLRIVGVGVSGFDVRPSSGFFISVVQATPALLATPAAKASHGIEELGDESALIRLRAHDERAVESLFSAAAERGISLQVSLARSDHTADVQRAVDPSAQALHLIAGLLAVAGLAVFGQLIIRQSSIEAAGLGVPRSLGAPPRALVALGAVWVVPVIAVAAVAAVATGYLTSALTPIGVARILEPSAAFRLDPGVTASAIAASSAIVGVIAVLAAMRNARLIRRVGTTPEPAPSRLVGWATAASLPAPVTAGLRFAVLPGRGRNAVPVRSGLLALVLATTTTVAALTFGAGLDQVLATPRLAGWTWDERLDYPTDDDRAPSPPEVERALSENPDVTDFALGTIFAPFPGRTLEVGRDRLGVGLLAFEPNGDDIGASVITGRAPVRSDEILLGPITAADIGAHVGDRIDVYGQTGEFDQPDTFEDVHRRMDVVGIGVLSIASGQRLGEGASVTPDGLAELASTAEPDSVFARFRPGADKAQVVRDLHHALGLTPPTDEDIENLFSLRTGFPNLDVRNIRSMPAFIVALMAAMALAVLLHLIISSISLRRRDLSFLQTLGFRRRQVRRTIAAESAALTAIAVAVGVPLGLIVGRQLWVAFANRLHVVPEAPTPGFALVIAVPVALLAGQLVTALPAWFAARRAIADGLRTE